MAEDMMGKPLGKVKPHPPIVGKVTSSCINLYWDPRQFPVTADDANSLFYILQEHDPGTGTFDTVYSGKEASYTAKGLNSKQQYKFRLRLCCANRKSQFSPTVAVTTTAQGVTASELHRMVAIVKDDDVSEFENILDRKGVAVDARDTMGRTLLMKACELGKPNVCEAVLSRGCQINATTPSMKTPLMFACIGGHAAVVDLLLSKPYSADATCVDRGGSTAAMYACDTGRVGVLKALQKGGASVTDVDSRTKETTLHRLGAMSGNAQCAEFLLKHGVNGNAKDANGRTALMIATTNNNVDMVRLLLSKGCDANITSTSGATALDMATGLGRTLIVELLSPYA